MRRLLALLAVLGYPSVWAGEGFYMGLEGGGNVVPKQTLRQGGSETGELKFDAGFLGGLTFGYSTGVGLRPELELAYRRNELNKFGPSLGGSFAAGGSLDASTVMANLWLDLGDRLAVVHPYFGLGVGGARIAYRDPSFTGLPLRDADRTLLAYQGGAGLGFNFGPVVTVSMDYRYLQTNVGNFDLDAGPSISARYRAHAGMATLRFAFGGGGDDVEPRVIATGRPKTRLPPPPKDTDGDGVPDDSDKCASTPPGFKIDLSGCITQQTVVLQAVDFQFGSTDLTYSSRQTLDPIAAALRGQPDLIVEIGGHTDSVGSAAANLKLSQRRAETVRKYLVAQGVPAENLKAKGYGKTKPIADNTTEEGRAQNRRVQFAVLTNPGSTTRPVSQSRAPGDSSPADPARR